jgi:transcriptional regulator with XRE-family HTH domain
MKRKPRSKPTTLGQRLRAARLAAGLRQNQVPGVGQAMISYLEADQKRPSIATLQAMAAAYDVTCGELLD